MRKLKKLPIIVAGIAAAILILCALLIFQEQDPTLQIELPKILTVEDGILGNEYYQWVVTPEIKGTLDHFALRASGFLRTLGTLEIKLPSNRIIERPVIATDATDLLSRLNPPPLAPPSGPRPLTLLVWRESDVEDIDPKDCQFRITLSVDEGEYRWEKATERLTELGIWNPSRGLLTDDLLNRLTKTGPYPVSSEWVRPSIVDYKVGDSLQTESGE